MVRRSERVKVVDLGAQAMIDVLAKLDGKRVLKIEGLPADARVLGAR